MLNLLPLLNMFLSVAKNFLDNYIIERYEKWVHTDILKKIEKLSDNMITKIHFLHVRLGKFLDNLGNKGLL